MDLTQLTDRALAAKQISLKERNASHLSELENLATLDDDAFTPQHQDRFERITRASDRIRAELALVDVELQERRVRTENDLAEGVASGRYGTFPGIPNADPLRSGGRRLRFGGDPWLGDTIRSVELVDGTEIRDRALAAYERAGETAATKIDTAKRDRLADALETRAGREVAEFVTVSSDPAYLSAFTKLVRDPMNGHRGFTGHELAAFQRAQDWSLRAMNEGTTTSGGFLIPFMLDPSIIIENAGTLNPWRTMSRNETITSSVWHGVSSAGVTAEWTAEASEFADASPTIAQPSVTVSKADAYVQASWEVVQDSNLIPQLAKLFSDARDRLEATAFAVGTGGTQPTGVITTIAATTASRVTATTNGSFGSADVFALDQNLPPRYQPNRSWTSHWSIASTIRQFASGPSPQNAAFWADLGADVPSLLLGRPYRPNSDMKGTPLSAATASSDDVLIVGDFSEGYLVVDRVGMQVVTNPVVLGSNRRPTGETGFAAWWRVGGGVLDADAFRLLRV